MVQKCNNGVKISCVLVCVLLKISKRKKQDRGYESMDDRDERNKCLKKQTHFVGDSFLFCGDLVSDCSFFFFTKEDKIRWIN